MSIYLMENNKKIRVAITQGDTNGIGYELIFKVFADPEMLELCTPIIYGSPKVAAYYRNLLEIEANFTIISDASEATDGVVNQLTTYEEEVKVEPGVASETSGDYAPQGPRLRLGRLSRGPLRRPRHQSHRQHQRVSV